MEKQKILVVDDDKHIAELISLYMMKELPIRRRWRRGCNGLKR